MTEVILPIALGLCISIIGFFNMKGNISSIHWYHRKRVKDEDKLIFGKLVGYGNIIIGNSISISGLFNFLAQIIGNQLFSIIGMTMCVIGVILGLAISFYAMIKYNKGIF